MKNNRFIIFIGFGCIVVLSFFLRLYNFHQNMWWFGDTARDVLVADHIAHKHELLLIGHTASFFPGGGYYHPPYYYYGLAFLSLLFRQAPLIVGSVVIFTCLLPVLLYFIGTSLFTPLVGFVAALFAALSAALIDAAHPWPAYVAPIFFYIGLLLIHRSRPHSLPLSWFAGMTCMVFGGMIHYAVLVCAGVILAVDVLLKQSWMDKLIKIGFFIGITCLFLMPLMIVFGPQNFYQHIISSKGTTYTISHFLLNYVQTMKNIWILLFDNNRSFAAIGMFLCGIFCLIRHRTIKRFCEKSPYIIALIFCVPLFSSFRTTVPDTYLYITLLPALILFLSVVFIYGWDRFSVLQKTLSLTAVICFLFLLIDNFQPTLQKNSSYYQKTRFVTSFIYDDAVRRDIRTSFGIIGGSPETTYAWSKPEYWYFLEKEYHMNVGKNVNYGENIDLVGEQPRYIYLICRLYGSDVHKCYDPFLQDHPAYRLIRELIHPFGDEYKIYLYRAQD